VANEFQGAATSQISACIDCGPHFFYPSQPARVVGRISSPPWFGKRAGAALAFAMKLLLQLGAVLALALSLFGGCQLLREPEAIVQGRSPLRPADSSPDSVAMEIVWARFPAGDPRLNEAAWQGIDETSIAPNVQRELASNGFRAGVIAGALPVELAAALRQGEATSDDKTPDGGESLESLMVEPTIRGRLVQARRGRRVEILASETYPSLPLLMDNNGELGGRTYRDAHAMYALEVDPQPDRTVVVELTPELHHGSPRVRWSQGDGGVLRQAPMHDHEVFDRLRLAVKLAPGEMLVLMSRPDAGSRLGHYFHTVDSADGRQQKLILIRLAEVPPSGTFANMNGR
jgi:hypothetical protein